MAINFSLRTSSKGFANFSQRNLCRCFCTERKLTNEEVRKKRCQIYDDERNRQRSLITRIEKIQVDYKGLPEECSLIMNKGLSTPYNCAMHIGEHLTQQSVLALVNDKVWDMHKPLTEDCTLKFLHFKDDDPEAVNKAFWTSSAFLLGHVLETAFKDDYYVQLCGFPRSHFQYGSFVHDANTGIGLKWNPTSNELLILSRIATKLAAEDLKFESMEIDASIADEMFKDNKYKAEQVPSIAAKSRHGNKVTVYRVGDHLDMSAGPMIASTSLIGYYRVATAYKYECRKYGVIHRFQGVALPAQLKLHYTSFDVLVKRAATKNTVPSVGEMMLKKQGTFEGLKESAKKTFSFRL